MEAAEWYKLRNNRTNRIDNILLDSDSQPITVNVVKYDDWHGQIMAVSLVNILSRWCRRIIVYMPDDVPCLIDRWSDQTLNDVINQIISSADPYGEFKIVSDYNIDTPSEFNICIGNQEAIGQYWIDSCGWIAAFGYDTNSKISSSAPNDRNPIGAVYAASRICSIIFSKYTNQKEFELIPFENYHSLFDFKTANTPYNLSNPFWDATLDIGKVWQIGAGAVGSTFDFILSLIPVAGRLDIIDYDKVEIPNTSSSLIFTASDAIDNKTKVGACKSALSSNQKLSCEEHPDKDFGQFVRKVNLLKDYPDLILCFANEKNVWSTIQNNEPPVVLHATTSSNWGVNFGRHIPFKEWCIVCRFGVDDLEYVPVCSEAVSVEGDQIEEKLGILPFLSPVAAVLVLAEILKLNMLIGDEYPVNPNFIQLSMKGIVSSAPMSISMKSDDKCPVCSSQDKSSYIDGYRNSKYYIG